MKKALFLMIMAVSVIAFAQTKLKNPVQWGAPVVGGAGCANAAAHVQVKNNKLEVLFSDFKITADSDVQKIERKNCSVRIPVQLSPGFQLILSTIESEGTIFSNSGFGSRLEMSVGFVGERNSKLIVSKKIETGSLSAIKKLGSKEVAFSPCGQQAMIALNTSEHVIFYSHVARAQMSVDIKALRTQISVKKCN